jgi:uncharacterized protein YndB with AHSA1/START domain
MNNSNHYADAGMLIRRPVNKVFQALIDPKITTKFWFTKSSGKLEQGKTITWSWEMYNYSAEINVIKIIPNELIHIEWGNRDQKTKVEWTFKILGEDKTFVSVINSGFSGSPEELISAIRDATGGFSWLLSGLKAYLEYGIQLNLTADRFPKELGEH